MNSETETAYILNRNNASSNELVDHLFRHEAGKMVAVLARIFGIHNIEMAEDVVQEAFLKAAQTWKYNTVPNNPSGWLMQVAKNKALDIIRHAQISHQYSAEVSKRIQAETENTVEQFFLDTEVADSQLRMMFACCHPSMHAEDQVALTLKTVSGFDVAEIAKALITNEAVIRKRLYRAKQFLKENRIELEIPSGKILLQRLDMIYTVLYLLFNEGYNSLKTDELIRKDICAEAMRLCLLLCEQKLCGRPATFALLSLMCFHASRFDSRLDENNDIILLQNQDRSKWDKDLIARGYYYLNLSSTGNHLSVYHIEAAIAAEHCHTASFEETDWHRLLDMYNMLYERKKTPVVQLNRAIVLSKLDQTEKAVDEILHIENLEKILNTQYIYNAVLGDLYMILKEKNKALKYLEKSHSLTTSKAEKKLIAEKMQRMRHEKNGHV